MPAHRQLHALFRASLAAGLGVLVFSLGLLAHLPAAHSWLHAAEHACISAGKPSAAPAGAKSPLSVADTDHACAIVAFAQGADTAPPAPLLAPPLPRLLARLSLSENAPCLRIPSGLLPPGRAPPASVR